MALTQKQKDATDCSLAACIRVGLYQGMNLNRAQFRKRPCEELVAACQKTCPLDPAAYGVCLLTFRETLRRCLKAKGYPRPRIYLSDLCAVWEEADGSFTPWTWADWCDALAETL